MSAVDEHGELDARRPAVREERLDRRPDRPAGVEDVVHEHAGRAGEREVEVGGVHDGLGAGGVVGCARRPDGT